MGSVIVTWKGRCERRATQAESLSFLEELAHDNARRWATLPEPRPLLGEALSVLQGNKLPSLPNLRLHSGEIGGKIVLCSDLVEDSDALLNAAARAAIEHQPMDPERKHHYLLTLDRLRLNGLDFRLFNRYALYPGADRMSYVFISCPALPFLDGRLAHVHDRETCAGASHDLIRAADWYIECPFVRLRRYLEGWTDALLAWLKFFFVPNLAYWRYDLLPGYAAHRRAFEALVQRQGEAAAKTEAFDDLLRDFAKEVERRARGAL